MVTFLLFFFRRQETNKVGDKNRIKAEMSDEVQELREEHEQGYQKRKLEYDDAMIRYKQQVKAKVRADNLKKIDNSGTSKCSKESFEHRFLSMSYDYSYTVVSGNWFEHCQHVLES